MKKNLLCVSLLSMFAAGFVGCSQKREWNHEQRKAMREALRSYRQMVYLDDLTDAPVDYQDYASEAEELADQIGRAHV